MTIKIFEVENGIVKPTEHCYVIKWLKAIMDAFPKEEDYLSAYAYVFYMTCPDPSLNPYFNVPSVDKEDSIIRGVGLTVSSEAPTIRVAMDECNKLFETSTTRAYNGISTMLDNLGEYMANTQITDGKDGNIAQLRAVAKDFDAIRQSYKGTLRDLEEEQSENHVRGNQNLSYDS